MRSVSPALRFRNAINVLTSIDKHEMIEAGVFGPDQVGDWLWLMSQHSPVKFVRSLNDEQLSRLWDVMETRGA